MKLWIVSYSLSGNTKGIADRLHKELGGTMTEIETVVPYTGDYNAIVAQGEDEIRRGFMPDIRPLGANAADYDTVILGTPVWAGRCSSVIRGFLKRRGYEIQNAAYLITHKSEQDYKDVFRQMDLYLQTPHVAEVSLCPDSAGYHFWRDQFVKACSDFIAEDKA